MRITVRSMSARAVQDSLGDHEALPGSKFDGSILHVDQESTLDHIEEFIVSVVFVPVIFAFYNRPTALPIG